MLLLPRPPVQLTGRVCDLFICVLLFCFRIQINTPGIQINTPGTLVSEFRSCVSRCSSPLASSAQVGVRISIRLVFSLSVSSASQDIC